MIEINLNDFIHWKPNEYALYCLRRDQREWVEKYGEAMDIHQRVIDKVQQALDNEMEVKQQLHEFAYYFGHNLFLHSPSPLEYFNVKIERVL